MMLIKELKEQLQALLLKVEEALKKPLDDPERTHFLLELNREIRAFILYKPGSLEDTENRLIHLFPLIEQSIALDFENALCESLKPLFKNCLSQKFKRERDDIVDRARAFSLPYFALAMVADTDPTRVDSLANMLSSFGERHQRFPCEVRIRNLALFHELIGETRNADQNPIAVNAEKLFSESDFATLEKMTFSSSEWEAISTKLKGQKVFKEKLRAQGVVTYYPSAGVVSVSFSSILLREDFTPLDKVIREVLSEERTRTYSGFSTLRKSLQTIKIQRTSQVTGRQLNAVIWDAGSYLKAMSRLQFQVPDGEAHLNKWSREPLRAWLQRADRFQDEKVSVDSMHLLQLGMKQLQIHKAHNYQQKTSVRDIEKYYLRLVEINPQLSGEGLNAVELQSIAEEALTGRGCFLGVEGMSVEGWLSFIERIVVDHDSPAWHSIRALREAYNSSSTHQSILSSAFQRWFAFVPKITHSLSKAGRDSLASQHWVTDDDHVSVLTVDLKALPAGRIRVDVSAMDGLLPQIVKRENASEALEQKISRIQDEIVAREREVALNYSNLFWGLCDRKRTFRGDSEAMTRELSALKESAENQNRVSGDYLRLSKEIKSLKGEVQTLEGLLKELASVEIKSIRQPYVQDDTNVLPLEYILFELFSDREEGIELIRALLNNHSSCYACHAFVLIKLLEELYNKSHENAQFTGSVLISNGETAVPTKDSFEEAFERLEDIYAEATTLLATFFNEKKVTDLQKFIQSAKIKSSPGLLSIHQKDGDVSRLVAVTKTIFPGGLLLASTPRAEIKSTAASLKPEREQEEEGVVTPEETPFLPHQKTMDSNRSAVSIDSGRRPPESTERGLSGRTTTSCSPLAGAGFALLSQHMAAREQRDTGTEVDHATPNKGAAQTSVYTTPVISGTFYGKHQPLPPVDRRNSSLLHPHFQKYP